MESTRKFCQFVNGFKKIISLRSFNHNIAQIPVYDKKRAEREMGINLTQKYSSTCLSVLVKEEIVKMAVVAFAFQGTFLKMNQHCNKKKLCFMSRWVKDRLNAQTNFNTSPSIHHHTE
jgi:hypothetical protein